MRYLKNTSTLKLSSEKCTGCGFCTDVCPHRVIEMRDKKAYIQDINACMECGACEINCAYGAISVDSGVGCASAIITGMLNNTEPTCDCSGDSTGGCC